MENEIPTPRLLPRAGMLQYISVPTNPQVLDPYTPKGSITNIAMFADLAYLMEGSAGIEVIKPDPITGVPTYVKTIGDAQGVVAVGLRHTVGI